MSQINVVTIGKLIEAHREGDEQKFKTYVDLIVKAYEEQENDRAARIIRSSYTGDYGEQGKVVLDEAVKQTVHYETGWYEPEILGSGGSYRGNTGIINKDTTIVMLGDCRNNRNYSGVEEVEWLSKRASNFFVLNPEPRDEWGQGDSIADLYAKSGAVVSMVGSAKDLLTFLQSAGTTRHF
mgnify:CR=1 FL=1